MTLWPLFNCYIEQTRVEQSQQQTPSNCHTRSSPTQWNLFNGKKRFQILTCPWSLTGVKQLSARYNNYKCEWCVVLTRCDYSQFPFSDYVRVAFVVARKHLLTNTIRDGISSFSIMSISLAPIIRADGWFCPSSLICCVVRLGWNGHLPDVINSLHLLFCFSIKTDKIKKGSS